MRSATRDGHVGDSGQDDGEVFELRNPKAAGELRGWISEHAGAFSDVQSLSYRYSSEALRVQRVWPRSPAAFFVFASVNALEHLLELRIELLSERK